MGRQHEWLRWSNKNRFSIVASIYGKYLEQMTLPRDHRLCRPKLSEPAIYIHHAESYIQSQNGRFLYHFCWIHSVKYTSHVRAYLLCCRVQTSLWTGRYSSRVPLWIVNFRFCVTSAIWHCWPRDPGPPPIVPSTYIPFVYLLPSHLTQTVPSCPLTNSYE